MTFKTVASSVVGSAPPSLENIRGRDVAQGHVIALVVVGAHKSGDCLLKVGRHLVGDLVNVPLQRLVVSLQLAVGLRVEGCCQDVPDADHAQGSP